MSAVRLSILISLVGLMFATPALAIDLGDQAPPLKIKEWIKGKPVDVTKNDGKSVYLVEFWATWCRPCRDSIPHLTKLQEKYKDKGVVIVGVSTDKKEGVEGVQQFVKKMDTKMDYTVAFDDDSKTEDAYQKAFGIRGIPHAFIIDQKSRIVWQGHPLDESLEEAIEQVLAGKYDLEKAKKEYAEERKRNENREKAVPLLQQYFVAGADSDNAEVTELLTKQLMPLIEKDAQMLNMFSWEILTNEQIKHRDLALALKTAKLANELTDGKDPSILDTYARALWDTGGKKQAIELQKQAVKMADEGGMKEELQKTLEQYEKDADK